jgi:periplasmic protein TonB
MDIIICRPAGATLNAQVFKTQHGDGPGEQGPGGERAAFDRTLPPSAFEQLFAAGGAGIFVLSADPALVATVRQITGGHHAVFFTSEWQALAEAIDGGRCNIALLDVDFVYGSLDRRLAELEGLAGSAVIIAASGIKQAPELMQALTARRIHRLLLKPASPGNTRLLLEAALNRWLQLRERPAADPAPAAEPRPAAPPRAAAGFTRRHGIALGVGMALVFAAVVVFGLTRPKAPETLPVAAPAPVLRAAPAPLADAPLVEDVAPAADEAPPPLETVAEPVAETVVVEPIVVEPMVEAAGETPAADASQRGEIESLLATSRQRVESGQLWQPQGDNALTYFTRAAALDRAAPDVAALRTELRGATVAAFGELLEAGEVGSAEELVGVVGRLGAPAAVMTELGVRLEAARAALQLEGEAALLATALERLREGQLLAPETDSAAFHLAALRAENPDHPGLAAAWAELTARLTENFQAAIAVADWSGAEFWLASLEEVDADSPLARALRAELTVTRRQAEFLATAVPATELTLLESRPPSYPEIALRTGRAGWVDVEFVVDRDGVPRELRVAEAEPPGTFERSALNAVEAYRYEPFALDGVVYERLARLRIRFALQ